MTETRGEAQRQMAGGDSDLAGFLHALTDILA